MAKRGAHQLQIMCALGVLLGLTAAPSAQAVPKSKLRAGKAAPRFRLRTLDGTMVRLDELAYPGREKSYAKKRPVLLDFFRTDCAPCRKSMPELVEMHKAHKGLEVVLIALLEKKDGRAKLERYLAKNQLPFTVAVDGNAYVAERYLGNPVTLPATFLIDHNGTLKKVKYGAGKLKKTFDKVTKAALAAHKGGR